MNAEKIEALKNYLIQDEQWTVEEAEDITESDDGKTYEIAGREYKVLTDAEADEEAREEIEYSLWAFNPDFIIQHTEFYKNSTPNEDEDAIEALKLMQGKMCESANALVKALIRDMDEFVEDAIDADGRGHFISWYDGEEEESGDFYIYRTN